MVLPPPARGAALASRVAQGVSGPPSSCVWNPRVFAVLLSDLGFIAILKGVRAGEGHAGKKMGVKIT